MTDTDPRAAFNAALIAFQKELPAIRKEQSADTGKFSYSYADLTAVTEAGLPKLAEHGLGFTADPTLDDAGRFVLAYALLHEAGHERGGKYPLPDPAQSTPQQIGSAITYGRRYSFCAATGLAPGGDDDDGAKASDARSAPAQAVDPLVALKKEIVRRGQMVNLVTTDDLAAKFAELNGGLVLSDATQPELNGFLSWLEKEFTRGQQELSKVAGVNRDGRTKAGTHEAAREASNPPESLPGVPENDPFYSEPVAP